jgi:hypothetical protein
MTIKKKETEESFVSIITINKYTTQQIIMTTIIINDKRSCKYFNEKKINGNIQFVLGMMT